MLKILMTVIKTASSHLVVTAAVGTAALGGTAAVVVPQVVKAVSAPAASRPAAAAAAASARAPHGKQTQATATTPAPTPSGAAPASTPAEAPETATQAAPVGPGAGPTGPGSAGTVGAESTRTTHSGAGGLTFYTYTDPGADPNTGTGSGNSAENEVVAPPRPAGVMPSVSGHIVSCSAAGTIDVATVEYDIAGGVYNYGGNTYETSLANWNGRTVVRTLSGQGVFSGAASVAGGMPLLQVLDPQSEEYMGTVMSVSVPTGGLCP